MKGEVYLCTDGFSSFPVTASGVPLLSTVKAHFEKACCTSRLSICSIVNNDTPVIFILFEVEEKNILNELKGTVNEKRERVI